MTETAQTVVDVTSAFSRWVASHVVVAGAVISAALPMMVIMQWIHLTTEELAGMQMGVVGIVTAITQGGTMSKIRAGVRIEEESERKSDIKAEIKVAQMMDSGQFPAPTFPKDVA